MKSKEEILNDVCDVIHQNTQGPRYWPDIKKAVQEYADQETAELRRKVEEVVEGDWKLIGHSYQIGDTGDYDGYYEITNGKTSLLTKDDDDEALQQIVNAFNRSGCKFYQDDWLKYENELLKEENSRLQRQLQSKPNLIVPGREEIENLARSMSYSNPHGRDGGYMVNFNKAKRNLVVGAVTWAINRIKELNK